MLFKNILRIVTSYRFYIVKIIFFEIVYLIKGYKGNKFSFTKTNVMSSNIPCPYYFLYKIKKILLARNFNIFLDLGCGSGRVIDFFQKNTLNKNFVGIEYLLNQFSYCKNIFNNNKNINIINTDFLKHDFSKYNADCYFFNHPIGDDLIFIELIRKIINFKRKKKILFIFVNCTDNIFEPLKNAECISKFYITSNKGYSIFCLNNN
jgi:SAM-dependent methyltransferase